MDVKKINFCARVDINDYWGVILPEEQKKIISKISEYGSEDYRYVIRTDKKSIAILDVFYKCGDKDIKILEATKVRMGKTSLEFLKNIVGVASIKFDFLSKQKHLY